MKTAWCPDCGDIYDSAAFHVCAPHVSTKTEEQTQPPQPGAGAYVHIPLAEYDALRARVEAAERELAQARAVVESRLAEVSQHDHTMRTLWGSHSRDREVEIRTLQRVLRDVKALGGAA